MEFLLLALFVFAFMQPSPAAAGAPPNLGMMTPPRPPDPNIIAGNPDAQAAHVATSQLPPASVALKASLQGPRALAARIAATVPSSVAPAAVAAVKVAPGQGFGSTSARGRLN